MTESPTPAVKKWSKSVKKMVGMALAGGFFGGIGLAFLIEMVLDGTVKRPGEIEEIASAAVHFDTRHSPERSPLRQGPAGRANGNRRNY